jgi:hypothetical protein
MDLQHNFFPDVHVNTIKRELRETGPGSHIRRAVPFISKPNLKKRREWAESFLKWIAED